MITIDMPCNVGDTIYTIVNNIHIVEVVVVSAVKLRDDEKIKAIDEGCGGYTFRKGNFGYDVFLTREEAEQVVHHRNVINSYCNRSDFNPKFGGKQNEIS